MSYNFIYHFMEENEESYSYPKVGVPELRKFMDYPIWATFCRELLLDRIMGNLDDYSNATGLRVYCKSMQYDKVARLMIEKPKGLDKAASFLSTLGVVNLESLELEPSPASYELNKTTVGNGAILTSEKLYHDIEYAVVVDFSIDTASMIDISAVLGILREEYIIKNILNGKIHNITTLATFLMKLVKIRKLRTRDTHWEYKQAMTKRTNTEIMHSFLNGVGTDYLSIFLLSVYFLIREIVVGDPTEINGPVNLVLENYSNSMSSKLKSLVKSPKDSEGISLVEAINGACGCFSVKKLKTSLNAMIVDSDDDDDDDDDVYTDFDEDELSTILSILKDFGNEN